jgi:hypothetical protein
MSEALIRAVPTTYSGTRFRSVLEANWACTLDSLGITWQYEPEPYELPSGEKYAPDFWLPTQRIWLEVKGPHGKRLNKTRELDAVLAAEFGTWETPYVVVGGPPTNGEITLQAPDNNPVHILECGQCQHFTIMRENCAWLCRICRHELRLLYFRPHISFVRAPHLAHPVSPRGAHAREDTG